MTPKLKILYMDSGFRVAGGQRSLLLNLEHLDPTKYELHVLAPKGSLLLNQLPKNIIPHTFSLTRRQPDKGYSHFLIPIYAYEVLATLFKIIFLQRKEHFDLFHANTTEAALFCGLASQWTKTPALFHMRNSENRKRANNFISQWCDKIIFVSEDVYQSLDFNLKKPNQKAVIHNAIDLDVFDSTTPAPLHQELNLPSSSFLALNIGRLTPEKRQKELIQSLLPIFKEFPHFHLLLLGEPYFHSDDQYKQSLIDCISKNQLEDQVHFLGFRDNVPSILKSCDLVLHYSLKEAFSRVPIESMAAKKNIIALNCNGMREAILDQETGFIIPTDQEDHYLECLRTVLLDPKLNEDMGQKGYTRAVEHFSMASLTKKLDELYQEALSSKSE